MVKNYTCGQCGKIFYQKGHYTNHLNRKTSISSGQIALTSQRIGLERCFLKVFVTWVNGRLKRISFRCGNTRELTHS